MHSYSLCPLTLSLVSCPVSNNSSVFFAALPRCIPSLIAPLFVLTKPTLSFLFLYLPSFFFILLLSLCVWLFYFYCCHFFFLFFCAILILPNVFSPPSLFSIRHSYLILLLNSIFFLFLILFFFLFLLLPCDCQQPACLTLSLCLYFQDALVVCSSSHSSSREEPVIPAHHCF